MTTRVQRRRGTAAEHAAFTGVVGEITVDTTNNRAVVHDGTTAGGHAAAKYAEVVLTASLGAGLATALAVNVGSAGAPVVNGGALGTPSSGTLTNATGLPISTGVAGLGANVATALAIAIDSAGAVARLAAQTFLGKQTFDAQIKFSTLPPEYADDAAAAGGGLAVGDVYRTGSALKVRAA